MSKRLQDFLATFIWIFSMASAVALGAIAIVHGVPWLYAVTGSAGVTLVGAITVVALLMASVVAIVSPGTP